MLISIRVTQVCFGANTKMLKTKRTPFLLWSRAVAASSVEKWGVKQGGWNKWKGNGKGYNNFICKLQRLSSRRNLVWGFKSRNICARGGGVFYLKGYVKDIVEECFRYFGSMIYDSVEILMNIPQCVISVISLQLTIIVFMKASFLIKLSFIWDLVIKW